MYRNTVPGLEVPQNPHPPPLVRHGYLQSQQLQQPLSMCQFASSSFSSMSAAPTFVQNSSTLQQSTPHVQPTAAHQTTSLYSQAKFVSTPCTQQLPSLQRLPSHVQPELASQAQLPFANAASLAQHVSNQPNPYSGRVYNFPSIPVQQSFTEQNQKPGHQTHPAQMFQVNAVNRMDTSFARPPIDGVEQQKFQHNVPGNSSVFSNIQNPPRMPTVVTNDQIRPLPAHQQKHSSLMTQNIALTEMHKHSAARFTMQQLGNTFSSFQQIGKNTSGELSALPGQNNNIPFQGTRTGYFGYRSTLSAQGERNSSNFSTSRHTVAQPMLRDNFPGNSANHGGVQGQNQGTHHGFHQICLNSQSENFVHHGSRPTSQDQTVKHFGNKSMLPQQNVRHPGRIPQFQGQMEHLNLSSTFNDDTSASLDANMLEHSNDITQQMGISEKTSVSLRHKSDLLNLSPLYEKHGTVSSQTSATAQSHSLAQATSQSNDCSSVKLPGVEYQSVPQDVALIQSAFLIPQSSQNTESHSRWYAHPFSTQPVITEEQSESRNYPNDIADIVKCLETPNVPESASPPCTHVVSSPHCQTSPAINSVLTEEISVSSSGAEIEAVDKLLGFHTNEKQENDESDLSIVTLSQRLKEAESILDLNKKKVIDELVLDSQYSCEDIDIRSYLPSPEFPSDFKPTELSKDKQNLVPCSDSNDLEVKTLEEGCDTDDSQMSLLQPAVEMNKVENPSLVNQIGGKRKHDSISDDKTTLLYSPPVKFARGSENKIGFGKGCGKKWKNRGGRSLVSRARKSPRGRGSTRGRPWLVKGFSDVRKKNAISRRKQSTGTFRGDGRVQKQMSEQFESHDCKTSATITKIDEQVIQKPDELKALMDTFNNDELERHAVPLSTFKLLFDHWSQNTASKDKSEPGSNKTSMKDKSEGETVDCNYENSPKDKSKDENADFSYEISVVDKSEGETVGCNDDDHAKDKSSDEIHDEDNEKNAGSICKDASEPNMYTDVASSVAVGENGSTSALQNNDGPDNTETFQTKKRRNVGNEKSHADGSEELSVQSCFDKILDKDASASNVKVEIEKYKDKENDFDNQELEQKDHNSGVESQKPSVKELNCVIKNITAQSYSLTVDHKLTWVRFHGKTVTRLISPDGTFFILKEILRRCFRIKEPNKRGKYKKIGITKREILKIPDIRMESVFFDFVVQNLKDRDIIRTVPDHFEIISEDNANRLFHYVCGEKYCKDGCIAPYLRSSEPKNISTSNKSAKSGGTIKAHCGHNLDEDRNVFEIIKEETKSEYVKLKLRKKMSSIEIKDSEVIDLCSDESDGYDTDKTCPYVDGQPNIDSAIKEIEEQKLNEQYQSTDRNVTDNNLMAEPGVTIDEDKVVEYSVTHGTDKSTLGEICNDEKDICKKTFDKLKKQLSTIVPSNEETLKSKEDIVKDVGPDSSEEVSNHPCMCEPVYHVDTPDSSILSKDPILSLSENEMNIQKNDAATSYPRIDACLDSEDASMDPSENKCAKEHYADVDACEDDDVFIEGVTFPGPPKNYPEGGTEKLSEAHDTLMKIIEQANNAQTNEELSVVIDKVFRISKPLKSWTCSLFDSYESVLLTEAERIKRLTDMSESDEVDTGAMDTGDMYA